VANDPRQIYGVAVTVKLYMCVAAETRDEAHEIALQHFPEELENQVYNAVAVSATPLSECPNEFKHTLPWGVEKGDTRVNWDVARWFEEEGMKEQ